MKLIILCVLLVAGTQAVPWTSIRPLAPTNVERMRRAGFSTGRIIGGNEATPGQFPYIAALILDGVGVCGGSLISENIVLTAAHCVDGFITIEANLGAHNLYDFEEPGRVSLVTRDMNVHEDYDLATITNDIGFVVLPELVVLSPSIKVIRLPSRSQESETFEGVSVTAAGWGVYNSSFPEVSPRLNNAEMSVISNTECDQYLPEGFIVDSHLCAVEVTGTICNSDSGGPLVVKESDEIVTLIGITSFAPSRACESPSGFVRVTSFLDWIENNTGVNIRP